MNRLLILFLFLISSSLSATVYTVYNGGNGIANFDDLQTAINQAAAGDTIYVLGTFKPYDDSNTGRISLNKRLVLLGEGPFKTADGTINQDEFTFIDLLFLESGCDGSVISGFHLDAVRFGYSDGVGVTFTNLTFSNNRIDDLTIPNSNHLVTSLNLINNHIYPGDGGFKWEQTTGNNLQNNFIHFRRNFRPTGTNLLKNNLIVMWGRSTRVAYGTSGNGETLYEREWETENSTWENNVIFMSGYGGGTGVIDRLVLKASNVTLK